MTTPNVSLDELVANQSQPEVPLNRAMNRIDALIMRTALSFQSSLPGSPQDGDVYILSANAGGGLAGDIAYYSAGWYFITPRTGWTFYVVGSAAEYRFGIGSPTTWTVVP